MEKLRARVKFLERENLKLRAILGLSPDEPIPSSLEAIRRLQAFEGSTASLSAPAKPGSAAKGKSSIKRESSSASGRAVKKTKRSSGDDVSKEKDAFSVKKEKQEAEGSSKKSSSSQDAALGSTEVNPEISRQEAEQSLRTEKLKIAKYKQWKQFLPFLYEYVVTHVLPWPSLTVAWVPDIPLAPSNPNSPNFNSSNYMTHRLLLGCNEPNSLEYISLCQVRLPLIRSDVGKRMKLGAKAPVRPKGSGYKYAARLEKLCEYRQKSLVHRVRPMPQYPELCASSTMDGSINVLRSTYDDLQNSRMEEFMVLKGHSKHGYGLCWSTLEQGKLLSSAEDSLVCLWDVEAGITYPGRGPNTLKPVSKFEAHLKGVGDVRWHPSRVHEFASVDEDAILALWDARTVSRPGQKVKAADSEIYCVDFSRAHDHQLVTGASDSSVRLWDTRTLKHPIHSFNFHSNDILQIQWSPFNPHVFCTSSSDTKVCIWDTRLINAKQTDQEVLDGPPELIFVHSGHTESVFDVSWNLHEEWTLASTAEDNIVQIWSVAMPLRTPAS